MIIKEYKAPEPSGGRLRIFVDVSCDNCGTIYSRQKRFLKDTHGCSPKCLSVLKGTRVKTKCGHCGKEIYKKKSSADNSKSGLLFCNRKCKEAGQRYIEDIMPDHYGTGQKDYRKLALDNLPNECNRCGYKENVKALDVHHIDRDRQNNELPNLEILCCNCHAIEHRGGAVGC